MPKNFFIIYLYKRMLYPRGFYGRGYWGGGCGPCVGPLGYKPFGYGYGYGLYGGYGL
jgi:hypothetical protein